MNVPGVGEIGTNERDFRGGAHPPGMRSLGATISSMTPLSRSKVFFFGVALSVGLAALAFACGSDDTASPQCTGAACDGGSESSTNDGPAGDTNISDGGGDRLPIECDGSGAGTLDPTFGDGGMVWLYNQGQAFSVVAQADGKILVGGQLPGQNLALVRLLPDGSLDSSFGDAGVVETKLGVLNSGLNSIALQTDEKIIGVTRTTIPSSGTGGTDFAVLRYFATGLLDTTFGDAGVTTTDFNNGEDIPRSLVVLADGRILVGGQSGPTDGGTNIDFALARYATNGSLDTGFGSGGKVTIDVNGTGDVGSYVALASGGKMIVAGKTGTTPSNSDFAMSAVRLNADGAIDSTFANGGKMVSAFTGAAYATIVDVTDRIILGGNDVAAGFGLLRLLPLGGADSTFGNAGLVTTSFSGGDTITSLLPQEDGRLIAVGASLDLSGAFSIASARYLADGRLDTAFGSSGKSLIAPPPNADVSASGAAIDGCTFVSASTWTYAKNSIPQNAMGIARFYR